MRSVFLSLCLLGATCDGSTDPATSTETGPGDIECLDPITETGDDDDASQTPPGAEMGDPDDHATQTKDGQRPDTGIDYMQRRVERQIDEADRVIIMLSKDAN